MPPKKGPGRRAKVADADPPSTPSRRSARISPNLGGGVLPHIPTKQSFAYGSSATPILPHMLAVKPKMNLAEMANTIEDAVQTAKEREMTDVQNSPAMSRISSRRTSVSPSPLRKPLRQPTPDEVQLLSSLNEVTARLESPFLTHSHSTVSSPSRKNSGTRRQSKSPVRPHVAHDSPPRFSLDDDSVISFNVERDIHDDELKVARSSLTAPPRRFSGLAFPHDRIEEEEEPAPMQESSTAPTRTTIPDRYIRGSPGQDSAKTRARMQEGDTRKDDGHRNKQDDSLWTNVFRAAILGSLLLFTIYTFKHALDPNAPGFGFSARTPRVSLNDSGLDVLNSLSDQVVKLGAQVSSLSKDVRVMRTDFSKRPSPTTIVQRPFDQERPKYNFLSKGMGIIIDPYLTSPTIGRQRTYFQRLYMWMAGNKHRPAQGPLAVVTPWEDIGECWCSAPRNGMSQIGILLGRPAVAEEVVVEHMPKTATLRPDLAPREMELWARYQYIGEDPRPKRSFFARMIRGSPKNIAGQDVLVPDRKKLRGPVMDALRLAWPGEPDTAFSDDWLLGPDFYRIGKWTYDINDDRHIQKFPVTPIIDSDDLRVDKVVFRVNSNWGANETCIYRLKLHGKP